MAFVCVHMYKHKVTGSLYANNVFH